MDIGWVWEVVQSVAVAYGSYALWTSVRTGVTEVADRQQARLDAATARLERESSKLVRFTSKADDRLSEHIRSPMHR